MSKYLNEEESTYTLGMPGWSEVHKYSLLDHQGWVRPALQKKLGIICKKQHSKAKPRLKFTFLYYFSI